jgi:uncharacterized protein
LKGQILWGPVLTADGKPVQMVFDVMAESLDKKYLLVGECKWTAKENGAALTEKLLDKARMLPFSGNYTIVPALFLKSRPDADAGNALLPEDIIRLSF